MNVSGATMQMSKTSGRLWVGLGLVAAIIVVPLIGWAAYAGIAWLAYGGTSSGGPVDPMVDRYMPSYDIREVHRTEVSAPASVTYRAAIDLDLHRSKIIHAVFRGREAMLRSGSSSRPANYPLTRELVAIGCGVLEERPGHEIVFGAVTQPWKPNVTFRALPPKSFAAFDSAGYVKIVVSLAADSLGREESIFRTETRVMTTDASSRAKFRHYWSIFSPGILLIRNRALQLVRTEAPKLYHRPIPDISSQNTPTVKTEGTR